jgi:histidinol-phosphate aminotransferase
MDVKKLVKKEVRSLQAYNAKEIPCRAKLDANESPFGFDIDLKALESIRTNRYPDPEAKTLKKLLAKDYRVDSSNILQGNGSDELIYYLITTFGGPVLYPVPTFSMYGIIAQALGEKGVEIPLDGDFDLDADRMSKAIRKEKPKLVFLSSPNNPTGNCFSAGRILKIVEASPGLVVVDEAYQPFAGGRGFLPMLKDYENLLIMRTLSKIGLAALRLGFLVADARIIAEINKVRLPFNVNSFSQTMAVKALKEKKVLRSFIKNIVSERERLLKEMNEIAGTSPFPSEANFVLFKVKDPSGLHNSLLNKGILVRNIKDSVPGCLRVTIGTREENTAFLTELKRILERRRF